MELPQGHNKKPGRVVMVTAALLIIAMLAFFIIRPSVIGYAIYQNAKASELSIKDYGKNIQDLQERILILETNISAASSFSSQILAELEKNSQKAAEQTAELAVLKEAKNASESRYLEEIEKLESANNKLLEKTGSVAQELSLWKKQYDSLAANTANNVCCKAKVDNPAIAYYTVQNNRIVCLEEGSLQLSC